MEKPTISGQCKFSVQEILGQLLQSMKNNNNQNYDKDYAGMSKQAYKSNSNQYQIQWDGVILSEQNIKEMNSQKAMTQLLKIFSKFESIFQQIKQNFQFLPDILKQPIYQILKKQSDSNQSLYAKLLEKIFFKLDEQQKCQAQYLNSFIHSYFLNYQTILARQTAHIDQVFFSKQGFKFQIPKTKSPKQIQSEYVCQIQKIQKQTVMQKLNIDSEQIYKVQIIQSSKLLATSHIKNTIYFKLYIHQTLMFDGIQKTQFFLKNVNKCQIVLQARNENKKLTITFQKEFLNQEEIKSISIPPINSAKTKSILSKAFQQKNLQLEITDIYSMEILKM